MKKSKLFPAFLVLVLTPLSLFAADDTLFGREGGGFGPKPESLTFTMYGGNYLKGKGQDLFTNHDWMTKTWDLGLRAGWVFTKYVEAEIGSGFVRTKITADKEDVYLLNANLIGQYPLLDDRLVPFLTGGAGGVWFRPERTPSFTRFAINFGGGLKYFIFQDLALMVGARGLTTFNKSHTALLIDYGLVYYFELNRPKAALKPVEAPPPPLATPEPTPEPTPMPTPMPTPKPVSLSELDQFGGVIEGITFETGKDVITQESYATLDRASGFFARHPQLSLRIDGHTDNTGSAPRNMKLSKARAEAVHQYMLQKGVGKDQMTTAGYGSTKPIAGNKTPEGRRKNRRIEFKILNPEALSAQ